MTRKTKLDGMRECLIQRRDALRQALAGDDSLLKELSRQQGGDVADVASDTAFGELNSQLAEVGGQELREIEDALARLRDGTYGECEGCRRKIPLARLKVLPYASFCVECKRLAEEAGFEPGTVVDWSLILDPQDSGTLSDLDFQVP